LANIEKIVAKDEETLASLAVQFPIASYVLDF